jgi:hypothetical protein
MKITVNSTNLIRNLSAVFSNNTRFIGELIQNSRRAGATQINITRHAKGSEYLGKPLAYEMLEFVDDGKGVQDFSKLLTVAESGWDEATQSTEHPYGMGFLSAVFACERMEIESNGKMMSFDCDALISGGSADIRDYPMNGGARFVLINPKFDASKLEDTANWYGRGLEMTVYCNGEKVDNFSCPSVCDIEIPGIGVAHVGSSRNIDDFAVFLQGMLTGGVLRYATRNFIHVTNPSFKARMPDREGFINHDEVMKLMKAAWEEHVVKALLREAVSRQDADEVDAILNYASFSMTEYVIGLGCVPYKAIVRIDEHKPEKTVFDTQGLVVVPESWLESEDYDFSHADNVLRLSYCDALRESGVKLVIIKDSYAPHIATLTTPNLTINVQGESEQSVYLDTGYMRWNFEDIGGVTVLRAKAIIVNSELGEVVMSNDNGYGSMMLLPMDITAPDSSAVVYQLGNTPNFGSWYNIVYNFEDEYDTYHEDWEEDNDRVVQAEMLKLFDTTSEQRLQDVYAGELRWLLINAGVAANESFTIGLDENNQIVIRSA